MGIRTFFDSIVTLCSWAQKGILIDITCLKEAYRKVKIACFSWISSLLNLSDTMKKECALHQMLMTHTIHTRVEPHET